MPSRTRALLLSVLGILGTGAVLVQDPWGWWAGAGVGRSGRTSEPAGLEALPARGPTLQGRDGAPARSTGPEALRYAVGEWPVALAQADRERDLFGVVVDGAGRAVAGARVSTRLHPWRGAGLLTHGRYEEHVEGPAAVTGADGAFRLRLEPGQVVTLQVQAAGFAPVALPGRVAGERVRVELGPGVVVRVTARTVEGQPAAGARLSVGSSGPIQQQLVTDAEGRAVSAPLAVLAGAAASVSVEVPVQPGWAWVSDNHPVPLGARELDVALTLARARTLTGRVTDAATGWPVPGASVGLGWTCEEPVTTDADGRYVQPAVPSDGYHELTVRAPGYAAEEQRFGERTQLDFALAREATLTGRAVDGRGRALAGVRVVANGSRFEGSVQTTSFSDALSGPGGAFTLLGLRADMAHEVVLRHPGFGRANVEAPPVGAPGGTRDLGNVVLRAGRTLAGRVEGSAGEARPDLEVTLMGPREPREPGLDFDYGRTETVRTDDLGRFRFPDLGPGRYVLRAIEREPIEASRELTLEESDLLDVRLLLPQGRRLRLLPLDPSGATLLNLDVRYRWDGGSRQAGVWGARELDLVLPEGARHVVLDVQALSRPDLLRPGSVAVPDDATEVLVRFSRAEVVGGLLLDPQGRGLPMARVLVRRGDEVLGSAWTEDGGTFSVGFAGEGPVDVAFEGETMGTDQDGWERTLRRPLAAMLPGVQPGTRDLRLTARATPADGVLLLRVLDPGGQPAAAVGAALSPGVNRLPAPATDAAGGVRFERLPPGAYAVQLSVPEAQREAWLAPELSGLRPGAAVHEVRLKVPRLLSVQTVRPDGTPLPEAWVTAEVEGGAESRGSTDAEGRLRLALDPDGPLRVDLEAWARDAAGGEWHAAPTQATTAGGPVVLVLTPHDGVVR